ncbi:hypothetical protein CC85DRAFT_328187 [Cutaneotrichosporon oleaginosum]|uniref:Uncharacterized protein n=1 Tax=Cutaneotrichosporon oleaginosum TaxID=879819 RepID=A0A0J0XMZ0_9TREE|nr:uncharacterized protein CC85DRAFT_328187 [Cutaneotrichosporon oleaginosum]KLT42438.1 hypothetical protein CC85DRAFT_328187 [Cutaneotrichosporon oleaginosum]TXT06957.1 hypothetical protein COLE_06288 [Cutaneotrichosporon oleaginosum]
MSAFGWSKSPPPPPPRPRNPYATAPESPPDFSPRSAAEAAALYQAYPGAFTDFWGLPSNPISLFKTGVAFRQLEGPGQFRLRRKLVPVTRDHPVAPYWPEICPNIESYLNQRSVWWTSIDPVRFAEQADQRLSGPPQHLPAVYAWVGVRPRTLTPAMAKSVALGIKAMLAEHGYTNLNLEVAFREACLFNHAMLPWTYPDPAAPRRHVVTPLLGMAIGIDQTEREGTGAVYYRVGGAIMLLTAAHVLLDPTPIAHNVGYDYKDATQPKILVSAPGNKAFKSLESGIKNEIELLNMCRKAALRESANPQNSADHRAYYRSYVSTTEGSIRIHQVLQSQVASIRGNLDLGHVRTADPIIHSDGGYRYTRDWGFVEVAPSNNAAITAVGNRVFIGDIESPEFMAKMYPRPDERPIHNVTEQGYIQVRGIVPQAGLSAPREHDAAGKPALHVLKNGRTTQTTLGVLNGLESRTRQTAGGQVKTSSELMVVSTQKHGIFSKKGDSGAAVLDRRGGLVGLLTAGSGSDGQHADVTYMTPFWWLDQIIKARFKNAQLMVP